LRVSGRRLSMNFVGLDLGFLRLDRDRVRHNAGRSGRSWGNRRDFDSRGWRLSGRAFRGRRLLTWRLHHPRRWIRGRHRRGQRRRRHGGRRRVVRASSTRGGEGESAAGKK